ncbi:MAG TPA: hypothetical protein VHQ47_20140 [Phycisphaerae bacterium]|jgi:hypothetical protein|nr:hypothetical protein [Phycisphaerae bacterium]
MTIGTPIHERTKAERNDKVISHRQSIKHADEAFHYFRRIRARLFKDPAYRNKFVGIRDRKIVGVGQDKLSLYTRLMEQFPDHRFVVSQVLSEVPTIDDPR